MSGPSLREQVVTLLRGGEAHAGVEESVRGFPAKWAGARVGSIVHTPWRLLEHLRIAQWDILEFSRNPSHVSPDFPEGYWPAGDAPDSAGDWDRAVEAFCAELREMQRLVQDPSIDLFAPIPHGEGQTTLREALVLADHNSYHLGQLVMIRRALESDA
jgi:hypothetical protein